MLVIAGDPKTFPMLLLPRLELNTTINRMFTAHLRHISHGWIPCHKEVRSRHHLANDPTKKNHSTIIGMAANGLVMSLPSSKGLVVVVLTSKALLDVVEIQDATKIRLFLHHIVTGLAKSEVFDLALPHKATLPPTWLTMHHRLLARTLEADEVAAEVSKWPYQHGWHRKMAQLLLLQQWNVREVVQQLSLILGLVIAAAPLWIMVLEAGGRPWIMVLEVVDLQWTFYPEELDEVEVEDVEWHSLLGWLKNKMDQEASKK
jgi:hypothetical protein